MRKYVIRKPISAEEVKITCVAEGTLAEQLKIVNTNPKGMENVSNINDIALRRLFDKNRSVFDELYVFTTLDVFMDLSSDMQVGKLTFSRNDLVGGEGLDG